MASKKKPSKKAVKKAPAKKKAKKVVKETDVVTPRFVQEQQNKADVIAHSTKDNITPHDKFNSLLFIIGLLAVIILLVVVSPIGDFDFGASNQNPEAIEGTHLLLNFDNPDMKVGDMVLLTIDANNFNDLVGFEISLGFNSDVLKFKSLNYGDFLGGNQGKICVPQKNLGGVIENIACIKLPSQPGVPEGVDGSGNLASIGFEVIGRGELLLQMDDIKLLNSKKESIDYQVVSPKINVR